jgi:hypothetical protein
MFGFNSDYSDSYGSDEEEAYAALSWSERMDMLEEMYERLGVDPKEWLKPPASFHKPPTTERWSPTSSSYLASDGLESVRRENG